MAANEPKPSLPVSDAQIAFEMAARKFLLNGFWGMPKIPVETNSDSDLYSIIKNA